MARIDWNRSLRRSVTPRRLRSTHDAFMPSSSSKTTSDGTPRIVDEIGATVTVDRLTAAAKKWATLAVSAGPERRLRSGLFHSGAYTLPPQGVPIGCPRATLLPIGNEDEGLGSWFPRLRTRVASFELRFISPLAILRPFSERPIRHNRARGSVRSPIRGRKPERGHSQGRGAPRSGLRSLTAVRAEATAVASRPSSEGHRV